jgi:CheY-like chemotaxis protein
VEATRPVMAARRHTLSVEEPAQPVLVHGDGTRLAQVLQNLLVNAAKYTPDGGSVRLRVEVEDGLAALSVTDNGRGLAPENLDRIFELFMQTETGPSSPVESGLGIGLTLARSLAEMHGGTIDATSPGLGQGSTFTVRLPTAAAEALEAGALRVLVVDDNRDSADSASDVLRLLGNRVECAYDGATALGVAPRFRPDVVLLDLAMPGMDGYAARARLLENGVTDAFFVAMTGYGNEDDKRRTREAGFDAHLVKPVGLDEVMAVLRAP